MEKLKQEIKDSGKYEYPEPEDNYQVFRAHDNDCELIFIKEKNREYIQICFPLEKNSPEGRVVAESYIEITLECLEKIIQIYLKFEGLE